MPEALRSCLPVKLLYTIQSMKLKTFCCNFGKTNEPKNSTNVDIKLKPVKKQSADHVYEI